MMEAKFTKGEWKINGNHIQVFPENPMETETVCMMYGSGETRDSNAKLIAAAPYMLRALQVGLDLLYACKFNSLDDQVAEMEAAIKKATD